MDLLSCCRNFFLFGIFAIMSEKSVMAPTRHVTVGRSHNQWEKKARNASALQFYRNAHFLRIYLCPFSAHPSALGLCVGC